MIEVCNAANQTDAFDRLFDYFIPWAADTSSVGSMDGSWAMPS